MTYSPLEIDLPLANRFELAAESPDSYLIWLELAFLGKNDFALAPEFAQGKVGLLYSSLLQSDGGRMVLRLLLGLVLTGIEIRYTEKDS
jgi:hypothetical protein